MSDTPQAQAEDRRAQIQARLDAFRKARFFGGGFGPQWGFAPVAADLYRNSDRDIEWLLAELSRLSSVEQALREALIAAQPFLFPGIDRGPAIKGWDEIVAAVDAALSASPSSEPLAALSPERAALVERLERWIADGSTDINEVPLDDYGKEVVREAAAALKG